MEIRSKVEIKVEEIIKINSIALNIINFFIEEVVIAIFICFVKILFINLYHFKNLIYQKLLFNYSVYK